MVGETELEVYVNRCVYEPSDDTELALEAMRILAGKGYRFESVVDIGSGSGALALGAIRLLRARRVAAVDISLCAGEAARATLPGWALVALCRDASCVRGTWDLAVVNPPYLPEEPGKVSPWECSEAYWWSGGGGVMESMVRAAGSIARSVLAVQSSLSPVDASTVLRDMGFKVEVLAFKSFFMERLEAVWAWRG